MENERKRNHVTYFQANADSFLSSFYSLCVCFARWQEKRNSRVVVVVVEEEEEQQQQE